MDGHEDDGDEREEQNVEHVPTQQRVGTYLGAAHQFARHLIDSGRVGKIMSGTAHVLGPGMESWHPNPDFFFAPGGGPILDMGPYYVNNLVNLVGPVKRVVALANKAREERTIGNGPRALEKIDMVADNLVIDEGGWTCGKDGQSVPVSQGIPTVRVASLTVGGRGA